MEGAAFTDGKNVTNMDEKSKILNLLANGPQDANGLSTQLGIFRNTLFALLMKMEKEGLIDWKGQEWAVRPASDSRQNDSPDSRQPTEGDPNA